MKQQIYIASSVFFMMLCSSVAEGALRQRRGDASGTASVADSSQKPDGWVEVVPDLQARIREEDLDKQYAQNRALRRALEAAKNQKEQDDKEFAELQVQLEQANKELRQAQADAMPDRRDAAQREIARLRNALIAAHDNISKLRIDCNRLVAQCTALELVKDGYFEVMRINSQSEPNITAPQTQIDQLVRQTHTDQPVRETHTDQENLRRNRYRELAQYGTLLGVVYAWHSWCAYWFAGSCGL